MRELDITIDDIYKAFYRGEDEKPSLLDTATGKVVKMSGDKSGQQSRYREIPTLSMMSCQVMMINFANAIDNSALKWKLLTASANKIDPLQEYNKVLKNYPLEEEKWQDYHRENIIIEIEQWLNQIGVKKA